jgi:sterol desaturase/sphingolipid hydroxylase (fatty acid hydroxylase superfamily)
MHHIHHSDDPRHFDKNMGGSLAIGDRMFGILYVPEGREFTSNRIGEENSEYRNLWALYSLPFVKELRHIRRSFTGHKKLQHH